MRRLTLLATLAVGVVLAPQASARIVAFQTPTGNIGCIGETARSGNFVRCDISRRTWSPPRKPASCPFDWGQGVTLHRLGRARFVCAGDTTLGSGPKLAYGRSRAIGGIVCRSRTTGLRCVNAAGHGFVMSRTRLTRF